MYESIVSNDSETCFTLSAICKFEIYLSSTFPSHCRKARFSSGGTLFLKIAFVLPIPFVSLQEGKNHFPIPCTPGTFPCSLLKISQVLALHFDQLYSECYSQCLVT